MMKSFTAIALVIAGPAFAQISGEKSPAPTDIEAREPPLHSLVTTPMPTPEAAAEDAAHKKYVGCQRALRYVPDAFDTASCADAKKKWDIIVKQNEARGQK